MFRKTPLSAVLAATLGTAVMLAAGTLPADEAEHYEAKASETFAEAVANFNEYNALVAEILEKEDLTFADMEQVHEYTYTIEVALAKMNEVLAELPATLEEVHLSSEGDDAAAFRENANAYLDTALELQ